MAYKIIIYSIILQGIYCAVICTNYIINKKPLQEYVRKCLAGERNILLENKLFGILKDYNQHNRVASEAKENAAREVINALFKDMNEYLAYCLETSIARDAIVHIDKQGLSDSLVGFNEAIADANMTVPGFKINEVQKAELLEILEYEMLKIYASMNPSLDN